MAISLTACATILSCADSRVPPELLFGGAGPGELFVARNAGNIVDTPTMGTIEYGAAVLGVPLIMVLAEGRSLNRQRGMIESQAHAAIADKSDYQPLRQSPGIELIARRCWQRLAITAALVINASP